MRERVGDASALVSFFKRRRPLVRVTTIKRPPGHSGATVQYHGKNSTSHTCLPAANLARGGALRATGPAHMPGQCNLNCRGSS